MICPPMQARTPGRIDITGTLVCDVPAPGSCCGRFEIVIGVVLECLPMRSRSDGPGFWLSHLGLPLLLCGCVARHVTLSEKGLTCAEAQRLAIDTVRRMGYAITESTNATPGTPGVILGSRTEGTTTRGLMVSVACTTLGAEVEAKSDQSGLSDLNFSSEFRRNFEAATLNRPPPRRAAESGVDVLITPERAGGFGDLGTDLSTAGILPVSVRITNHTPRLYRFQVNGVRLQTSSGERVGALGSAALTTQLGGDPAGVLQKKSMHDEDITPSETLTGVLFFPFNAYTGARVELIDKQSGEGEGFSIEF